VVVTVVVVFGRSSTFSEWLQLLCDSEWWVCVCVCVCVCPWSPARSLGEGRGKACVKENV
jgi:hypothetical protein